MTSAAPFPPGTLQLLRELFSRLPHDGVRYCHWKSTTSLPRALAGRTDLDLLVDAADAPRFHVLVTQLGFKRFVSHPSRRFPSVEDYLGLDTASGRLVHLHVYYRLVIGQDYVKNHALPIEAALLQELSTRDGVRVPPPAAELCILILRILLKYRDTDALKDLLRLGRRGGIPPDARAELEDLRQLASVDELLSAAARLIPSVPPSVFVDFVETMARDRRDARTLLRIRGEARRGLRRFERMSPWAARVRYFRARLVRAPLLRDVFGVLNRSELRRKSPAAGGLTVALVGADGAGKTTIVEALREWLGWRVNLSVAYLGTARPSRRTAVLQRLSRLARALARRLGVEGPHAPLERAVRLLSAVRYLAEADDRVARIRDGRHLADAGVVVVYDRYPLPFVRINGRSMDGPRIATLPGSTERGLVGLLRRREERMYRRLPPPDLALLLAISPELARSRKDSLRPDALAQKAHAIIAAARHADDPRVVSVDASRPLDEVLATVKDEIWRRL